MLEDKLTKNTFNILHSSDFYTNDNTCVLLISAEENSSPGEWSRVVCMNEGLVRGSVLSYIDFCNEK